MTHIKAPQNKGSILQRERALTAYHSHPNICRECGSLIEVRPTETVSEARSRLYCTRECASRHNWRGERNPKWKEGSDTEHTQSHWKRVYERTHPDAVRAHRILAETVRKGLIQKQACRVCGNITGVHGHHEDYSRPLDATWLCRKHHDEVRKLGLAALLAQTF